MLEVTKYLSICIILVWSTTIEASKSPEDCDYGDCGQTGYFASGSAYSSQVLLPDGSVVTNSKGSSISSDGIQRSFHELKQEADKYVPNSEPKTNYISRNEYADRVPILRGPQNQGMTDLPFIISSPQSNPRGLSPYSNQQQYTEEQKQSLNTNVNSYVYQPFQPSVQDGYQNNLPQESENTRAPGNVNSVPNSNQPSFMYYRTYPLEVPQEFLDSNVDTDNKLGSSSADASDSASSYQQKMKVSWQRLQDANANIPVYMLNSKSNTLTANGINPVYKNEEVNQYVGELIPVRSIPETHYSKESSIIEQQSEQNVNQHTPTALPKTLYHVKVTGDEGKKSKLDQNSQHAGVQNRSSRISGGAPIENRRPKLVIRAKSPLESVSSSQPFRRETHSQTIKSNAQALHADMNTRTQMVPALPEVPQNDAAAPQPDDYMYVPLPSNAQIPSLNDQAKSGSTNGHMFHLNFPILLQGVPQNVRIAFPNSNSKSSINQIYDSAIGSSLNSDGVNDSASNSLVPEGGNVAPQNLDKHSSSSSNLHYFITNGNVGEQLVPNSDIYVPSDAVIQQNRIFSQFFKGNANLNSEKASAQKSSNGFSPSVLSQSSDVNGKKIENRVASVTVDGNGKID